MALKIAPSFIVLVVIGTLFLSRVVQSEWVNFPANPPEYSYIASAYMSSATDLVMVGNQIAGGAVTYTNDAGLTWSAGTVSGAVTSFGALYDVAYADVSGADWVLAVDDAGKIYGSQDLAVSFTLASVVAFGLLGVTVHSSGTAYVAGVQSSVYKSSPPYTSWTNVSPNPATKRVFNSISSFDGVNVIAVGASGSVWYSTDSGSSWAEGSSGTTAAIYGVSHASSSVAMAAGSSSYVGLTTDSGATWSAMNVYPVNTVQSRFKSIFMLDVNNAFVGGSTGDIYKTSDGGVTWVLEYAVGTPIYTMQMQSTLVGIAGAGANIGAYIRVAGLLNNIYFLSLY